MTLFPDGFELAEFFFLLVLVWGWAAFLVILAQGCFALVRRALSMLDE